MPVRKVPRWLLVVVIALVVLPLGASAADQILAVGGSYHPVGDLADIELHTRDVGHHQVELGQFSRDDWSHPGPALFYVLALPYRVTGSSSIGMNLGALLINGLSVVGMLVLAHRRGGGSLLLIAAVGCALLLRGFGGVFLAQPWNPLMPVLPFGLFVFLIWEVTCGGLWALPAAAVVGTFCVQTHIGYIPLVLPLAGVGVASILWVTLRTAEPGTLAVRRQALRRPALLSVAALVLMWLPPVVQELRPGRGNLMRALRYFVGESNERAHACRRIQQRRGAVRGRPRMDHRTSPADHSHQRARSNQGSSAAGAAGACVAGAFIWWRRRATDALWLVALVAVATGFSVLAVARTIGPISHYRLGWLRVVAMIAVVTAYGPCGRCWSIDGRSWSGACSCRWRS